MTSEPGSSEGWRRFLILWLSQTTSMTAGGLTYFALGIWVFQQTRSATAFAAMTIATTLPGVVALPLAGVLADRWGQRRSLLIADLGAAAVGCAIAAAFVMDTVSTSSLYLLLGVAALLGSLHWPAYTAATTALVDAPRLARAASMMQFGYVGHHVLAPILAAPLLIAAGVSGVLAVDVVSFVVAALAVLLLRLPRRKSRSTRSPEASLKGELSTAMQDMRERGLLPLALYVAATYLPGGFVVALSTPLVLSIAGPGTAGIVLSIMGLGMVLGTTSSAVFVNSRGGVRRLLRFDLAMAVAMLLAGLAASPALIAVAGFLFLFGLGGHMGEEQAIWQVRIPVALQGRAFGLKRMMTFAALPVSYALAGPLADKVFEPMMAADGMLASSAGSVIGVGAGRGMALLLMCAGGVKLLVIVLASRSTRLASLNRPAG